MDLGLRTVRQMLSHTATTPYTSPCAKNLSFHHYKFSPRSDGIQQLEPSPTECSPTKQQVPVSLRPQVIQWVHTAHSSGHPWNQRTTSLVLNAFWWVVSSGTADYSHPVFPFYDSGSHFGFVCCVFPINLHMDYRSFALGDMLQWSTM